jgi:hypothetical protein
LKIRISNIYFTEVLWREDDGMYKISVV